MARDLTRDEEQGIVALRPIFQSIDRLRDEIEQLHKAVMQTLDNLTTLPTTDAEEANDA